MEINPFEHRPLYDENQVITIYDLNAVRNGYIYRYNSTRWYRLYDRLKYLIGVAVCNELLHWLVHGKADHGTVCKEDNNAV
jgi:hypothetical protein